MKMLTLAFITLFLIACVSVTSINSDGCDTVIVTVADLITTERVECAK